MEVGFFIFIASIVVPLGDFPHGYFASPYSSRNSVLSRHTKIAVAHFVIISHKSIVRCFPYHFFNIEPIKFLPIKQVQNIVSDMMSV